MAYLPQSWGSPLPSTRSEMQLQLAFPVAPRGELQPAPPSSAQLPTRPAGNLPLCFTPFSISPWARGDPSSGLPSFTSLRLAHPSRRLLGGYASTSFTQSAYLLPTTTGGGAEATAQADHPHHPQSIKQFPDMTHGFLSSSMESNPRVRITNRAKKFFRRLLPPFLQSRG